MEHRLEEMMLNERMKWEQNRDKLLQKMRELQMDNEDSITALGLVETGQTGKNVFRFWRHNFDNVHSSSIITRKALWF